MRCAYVIRTWCAVRVSRLLSAVTEAKPGRDAEEMPPAICREMAGCGVKRQLNSTTNQQGERKQHAVDGVFRIAIRAQIFDQVD